MVEVPWLSDRIEYWTVGLDSMTSITKQRGSKHRGLQQHLESATPIEKTITLSELVWD